MRWTQTLIPTLKETPSDAEVPSHQLMLRAGMIQQVMAGAYTYLPLGWRSVRKAAEIVREEMEAAGASELFMPALSPIELWERTGRRENFGNVLIDLEIKRGNRKVHLALGPTHEEVITDLISKTINSYRQLPLILFQIQTKFRNEERPRFGVLRTSEFLMKDAYSFGTSVEQLDESYQKMYDAYCRIFDRCGLKYLPVEAESGPIGGDASHEFMAPAENGEDRIVHCESCGYAANLERAETGRKTPNIAAPANMNNMQKMETPNAGSIEQVCKMLKCEPSQMIKTILFIADDTPVAVLVRGDHEVNEGKVRRALKAENVELAGEKTITEVTSAPVGFAGPVGLTCKVIADHDVPLVDNAITGANEKDAHFTGVNITRDFNLDETFDLRDAAEGDPCPRCESTLSQVHGIEVGHVFKLGTKYTTALNAEFLDTDEKRHPIIMGCYGIGINRIVASIAETSHDENGLIWPLAIAPHEVILVPMNVDDEATMQVAEDYYEQLRDMGVDVLMDDRKGRPGVKFKDADLIGIPLRIVIGGRGLKEGIVEVKWRTESEPQKIAIDEGVDAILQMLDERMSAEYGTDE